MTDTTARGPVSYSSGVEQPSPDEQATIDGLKEAFGKILRTTSTDYGRAVRGVHAKGHGLIKGTLTIADDLPPELAQGLFARGGRYDAILRVSTAPGDILDDAISSPRGVALKVLGVGGARLAGGPDDGAQDFLMVNGPVFGAPTPAQFLKNLKLLAATTDKGEGLKKAWSAVLQGVEGALETVGLKSTLVSQLGGVPETHPMGDTYFSQTAYRYGDYIAKISLKPRSKSLIERTGDRVNTDGRPDALREDVGEVMIVNGGGWDLCVQLCTDLDKMPVEDPTVLWDEKLSPFVTVASFEASPQVSWQGRDSEHLEDRLAFSPWNGLEAHRPLGAVNRVRKENYEFSASFRSGFNKCPITHAATLADL